MAKEENRKLTSEDRTDTVIHDQSSQEDLRLGLIRSEYEDDEGTEFNELIAENLECGDGTVISPGHLMRPESQGGVTLQRCHICQQKARWSIFRRNRPVNQFSPAAHMKHCFHCGRNLCYRHSYVYRNHVTCHRCKVLQFIIHGLLKPIFFRRIKGE